LGEGGDMVRDRGIWGERREGDKCHVSLRDVDTPHGDGCQCRRGKTYKQCHWLSLGGLVEAGEDEQATGDRDQKR
jgi:hypothetical protein